MPLKPMRPCRKAGCRNLTRDGCCEEHRHLDTEDKRERQMRYDETKRDRRAKAFYHSEEWRRTRPAALSRDFGLWQRCLKEKRIRSADMVHHVKPVRTCWELRLEMSSQVSLCDECHGKTDHGSPGSEKGSGGGDKIS